MFSSYIGSLFNNNDPAKTGDLQDQLSNNRPIKPHNFQNRLCAIGYNIDKVPKSFCCAITFMMMNNPVVLCNKADTAIDKDILPKLNSHPFTSESKEAIEVIPEDFDLKKHLDKLEKYQSFLVNQKVSERLQKLYQKEVQELQRKIDKYQTQKNLIEQMECFVSTLEKIDALQKQLMEIATPIKLEPDLLEDIDISLQASFLDDLNQQKYLIIQETLKKLIEEINVFITLVNQIIEGQCKQSENIMIDKICRKNERYAILSASLNPFIALTEKMIDGHFPSSVNPVLDQENKNLEKSKFLLNFKALLKHLSEPPQPTGLYVLSEVSKNKGATVSPATLFTLASSAQTLTFQEKYQSDIANGTQRRPGQGH